MNELHLQDKFLIPFFTDKVNGLGYKEVKANTISNNLIIEEDLKEFIKETSLNKDNYRKLLKKFKNEDELMKEFIKELQNRIKDSRNMALFFNSNKSITFQGLKFYLFYPSESETYNNELFEQNIFSVVQELPYKYEYEGKKIFSFRPDITIFLNGIFLSFNELKSNFSGQNAGKNGRNKIAKDYKEAVINYLHIVKFNDVSQTIRKDFLKIFEKAIHITTTDLEETYIIRHISQHFEDIKSFYQKSEWSKFESEYKQKVFLNCKTYPLSNYSLSKQDKLKEIFTSLYSKEMIEKEILYYNFIEKEVVKNKKGALLKNEKGNLISPRPKQKFGTDKIINKIDEFLDHEEDDDYFINKLKKDLKGVSPKLRKELIEKRLRYNNNKNVYSLLLQYAAGFGKSNIIGWSALQLKDLKRNQEYVYDKVMIVVDRLQLRDQIDRKMFNMNIDNRMYIEAKDKKTFKEALSSDKRIVIVNLQKFNSIKSILDKNVLNKLANMRTVFLIDEIHRSHSGSQNEEMMNLFDQLQTSFDNKEYTINKKKKNLLIGFTATPSEHVLARFGEFNKYGESERLWRPFDSYTMQEAIDDGYILNPLLNLVPVSAKMYYELPEDKTKGVTDDKDKKYTLNEKKKIYNNEERIDAISKFVVTRLVEDVYKKIRGQAKAMLAVSYIKGAIIYKEKIDKYFKEIIKEKKYRRFKDAPIYIVYSGDGQDNFKSNTLNKGLSESKVLQNYTLAKNGLIIVVDKLQTGFDEPKLHTLFLDKEIRNINAIQTIYRVNRKIKYKENCKIIDFSHKNKNIANIKSAFEHFSDVVVSDFDPFNELKLFEDLYDRLTKNEIYKTYFKFYIEKILNKRTDVQAVLSLEDNFSKYIKNNPKRSKTLKKEINQYFHILDLIQFVIDIDKKYTNYPFLEFWRKYNNEYNSLNKNVETKDDVNIYFDDQLGIVDVSDETPPTKKGLIGEKKESYGVKKYKYDILRILEKKNREEEIIGQSIEDFEIKISSFFNSVKESRDGKILIAKINSIGTKFTEDEIISDFGRIYHKFIRRHKLELGEFFITQTKDLIDILYADFEKQIKENLLNY